MDTTQTIKHIKSMHKEVIVFKIKYLNKNIYVLSSEDISLIQEHIYQIKNTVIRLVFSNLHKKEVLNHSYLLHYMSSQDSRTGNSKL